MYTPESILFPYLPRKKPRSTAVFCPVNEQRPSPKFEQYTPGGGLYGLPVKAQGSSWIFVRSFKQKFVASH
ncbi:hypothetical protein C8256_20985 [Kluyvera genomosp. 2]|uniref:Uncharacterized protein n=1 Tax=Kluyvera genomosp. 2 TaxID=2774054 RepID=A0A2T2XXE7_9ENTR|nr:hypothetical protein C8256_20985 [Kluyvera genomosp. 2]